MFGALSILTGAIRTATNAVTSVGKTAFNAVSNKMAQAGIPMPPGVTELVNISSSTATQITTTAGYTFNIADIGTSYVIDSTGRVLDMTWNGIQFLYDPVTKMVHAVTDVIYDAAGQPIGQLGDFLGFGKYGGYVQQLGEIGRFHESALRSLGDIANSINVLNAELDSWI